MRPRFRARASGEVLVEALPQCVMQAVIYVSVSNHVKAGTASSVDMELFLAKNGAFVSLMPKSILISTMASLKTWMELVQSAREAGLGVLERALQLWNVGAGMPLDALKKGAITEWACPHELDEAEDASSMIDGRDDDSDQGGGNHDNGGGGADIDDDDPKKKDADNSGMVAMSICGALVGVAGLAAAFVFWRKSKYREAAWSKEYERRVTTELTSTVNPAFVGGGDGGGGRGKPREMWH